MKVRCIKNHGSQFTQNHEAMGVFPQTKLYIGLGKEYFVLGMELCRGMIKYFIVDDSNMPDWYPKECFEIVNNQLPSNWKFATIDEPVSDIQALWGYPEMIDDPNHHDAVYDCDPNLIHYIRRLAIEMEEADCLKKED